MSNFEIFMIPLIVVLGVVIIVLAYGHDYKLRSLRASREDAIEAVHKYNIERIENGTWGEGMYGRALIPWDDMYRKSFPPYDKLAAINDEYKDLLEPYFED